MCCFPLNRRLTGSFVSVLFDCLFRYFLLSCFRRKKKKKKCATRQQQQQKSGPVDRLDFRSFAEYSRMSRALWMAFYAVANVFLFDLIRFFYLFLYFFHFFCRVLRFLKVNKIKMRISPPANGVITFLSNRKNSL